MSGAVKPASPAVSAAAQPISTEEFGVLIGGFVFSDKQIAIAVSGGPDSMALALCTQRWAAEKKISILSFIVDHGLRAESASEAERTLEQLAKLGINAEILRWEHAPVVTRLHISARKARYKLLMEACQRRGIGDLMLGHQQEDQAETILMRLAKGSGVDGLAGMRKESKRGDVRLLRPFLNVPKERLIATCHEARLAFIEDASNQAQKFGRGRLRRIMPLLAEEGLTLERLVDLGGRAGEAKEALDYYAQTFLRNATERDLAGVIRIDLKQFRALPRAVAGRVATEALQHIHAEDYAPEYAPLMRLVDAIRASAEMTPRTLHGCLVSKTETQMLCMREVAGILDAPTLRSGESVLWDERWKVSLAAGNENYIVRSLGHPEHEALDKIAPGLRKLVSQGRARASLPALWKEDRLVLVPSLKGESTLAQAQLVSVWPKV